MNDFPATARITIEIADNVYRSEGFGNRPGTAITQATMAVMRKVKAEFHGSALLQHAAARIRVTYLGYTFIGTGKDFHKGPGVAVHAATLDIMPTIREVDPKKKKNRAARRMPLSE